MEILLIRHGEAIADAPRLGDEGGWLTRTGRKVARRIARGRAKGPERKPVEIWTSPLVRAVQTAEILAERARPRDVSIHAELSPSADPTSAVALLAAYQGDGPLAIVGHEPSLSVIATSLLGDVRWEGLKKCGVLALGWDRSGSARMRFLLKPGDLTVETRLPVRELP